MDDRYAALGLSGIVAAGEPCMAHFGAALLAAWWFDRDARLPAPTSRAMGCQADAMIAKHSWLFEPRPPGRAARADRIGELVDGISDGLDHAWAIGHDVIYTALVVRTLKARPELASDAVIDGVLGVLSACRAFPIGPVAGVFGVEGVDAGEVAEAEVTADTALAEAALRAIVESDHVYVGLHQGDLGHVPDHAHALIWLERLGYREVAQRGRRGFREHLAAVRRARHLTAELPEARQREWVDPKGVEYWARGSMANDWAVGHLFKYPYAILDLLELTGDSALAERALEATATSRHPRSRGRLTDTDTEAARGAPGSSLRPLRARLPRSTTRPIRQLSAPRRIHWRLTLRGCGWRPGPMVMRSLETDYLVVGAGAMGMAFTDALVDHADVHVTLVDRRHAPGGHWQDAYPFVQLHQASVFYGVASTVLGSGAEQQSGPEAGLQERARQSEIRAYYDDVLHRRFLRSGRVTFLAGSEYHTDGSSHLVTSLVSGETVAVGVRRRVVDATYSSPTIPATTPPPFGVADDVRVVAINDLARLEAAPNSYVIVGSGKTATDGIVWLLANGVQPDRIVWVRPREPWMLNRAVVQPDPAVAIGLAADTMASAADAESLDDLFLRLEAAGVMLRIDTDVKPTMAKTPTVGAWELDLLRTIENVVRRGHIKHVTRHEIVLDDASVPLAPDSLVVHCAASGLAYPPLVPIWQPDKIRLQTIRVGFPCFCAALAGYVEATRDDDRERNRLCPPNNLPDRPSDWAQMQVRGTIAARTYGAEPDIAAWTNGCALNPARIEPSQHDNPAVQAAAHRLADHAEHGLARMAELGKDSLTSVNEL